MVGRLKLSETGEETHIQRDLVFFQIIFVFPRTLGILSGVQTFSMNKLSTDLHLESTFETVVSFFVVGRRKTFLQWDGGRPYDDTIQRQPLDYGQTKNKETST